jgi:hypothetical protein
MHGSTRHCKVSAVVILGSVSLFYAAPSDQEVVLCLSLLADSSDVSQVLHFRVGCENRAGWASGRQVLNCLSQVLRSVHLSIMLTEQYRRLLK